MNILIGCERSGRGREAFRAPGHSAYSCDIVPSDDNSPFHIQDDIRAHLHPIWDMLIAFPPCTYLSNISNGSKYYGLPGFERERDSAVELVKTIAAAPIHKIAIENPVGCLSTRWRKPDDIIQPWWFGHPYTKKTCLWLKNLPLLHETNVVRPTHGSWVVRHSNSPEWRSRTFKGVAEAMAEQWG